MIITRQQANQIAENFWWKKGMTYLTSPRWIWRAKKIAKKLAPFIPENGKVLDIGSGSGNNAEALSALVKADFTLLDVVDWNIADLPFMLFDGENIPFEDKRFDVAFLLDVVHHTENETALMKEAMRVAKKVVVLEEIHENSYMNIWANITDNFQWIIFGMPLGLHHRNKKQWMDFFGKFCSKIQYQKESFGHAIFVME